MSEKLLKSENHFKVEYSQRHYGALPAVEIDQIETKVSFDLVNATIGDFGKWQYQIAILLSLLRLPVNWIELGIVFLAPPTKFWCKLPKHDRSSVNLTARENTCFLEDLNNNTLKCQWGYEYDVSQIHSSVVTEWNLVCEREYIIYLLQFSLMSGVLLGSLSFGAAADRFGRQKALLIAILMQFVFGILTALAPWLGIFIILRFFLGIADGAIAAISFVMCMEALGGNARTFVSIIFQIPLGLGNIMMAAIAYEVRHWRQLQLVFSTLTGFFLFYFCLLPESPRWLLSVGERQRCIVILKKATKKNGIVNSGAFNKIVGDANIEDDSSVDMKPGLIALIKTREIRRRTFVIWLNWFILGIIYYGFHQYIEQYSYNNYVSVIMSGVATIPGFILCALISLKLKRKTIMFSSGLFTSVCCLLIISSKNVILQNVLAAAVFLGISVTASLVPLHTGECYPTNLRNAGVGAAVTCRKIGAIIAPIIAVESLKLAPYMPLVLIGCLCILQVLLVFPLPETKNADLPDSISDIED